MVSTRGPLVVDLSREERLTLAELAAALGVSLASVRRWAARGLAGVRLEVHRVGGRVLSSLAAERRFAERVAAAKAGGTTAPPRRPTVRQQQRNYRELCRQLKAVGLKPPPWPAEWGPEPEGG